MSLPHISVCICTYQRPEMLLRLLRALEPQLTGDRFTFSVVVADNDRAGSAREGVETFSRSSSLAVTYCSQPERNIALTRNAAIAHATGDLIAFIDDDEFPVPEWLLRLYETLVSGNAAAVLGPVRPHFETPPPAWVIQGRFCERPECPTGTALDWQNCRTGNVLFRRNIIAAGEPPFREEFGTGGEDKDFFMRLAKAGHTFVWCNEAVVSESVPASRLTRKYMLQRALLRGKNSLRITHHRAASLAKSVVAVPAYSLLLPLALVQGPARLMHTLIPLCDHAGKLLALVGLNPISERNM
ncbi:MAG: glycosyltransferase family 2 protein [Verrucomicrobiota bacterium]